MGALIHYSQSMPAAELEKKKKMKRCVEVFSYDSKIYLRIGGLNSEDASDNPYTVELSKRTAEELIEGIEDCMTHLSIK